jgi:hypothetical protein
VKPAPQIINQAPATAANVFNLAGTSITKDEEVNCDSYTGPLAELLAVGIVREDQLPPVGSCSVSWLRGVRLTRGMARNLDETYRRVVVRPSFAAVGVGLPAAIQQARRKEVAASRKAQDEEAAKAHRIKQAQAAAEPVRKALEALKDVPRTKGAYLHERAKIAKIMMDVVFKSAIDGSDWHGGWQIDSDSLEEIQAAMDGVLEAYLNAQVRFDAKRQAKVIAERQRKVLEADPYAASRLRDLTKPNPALLRGEAA